LSCDPTPSRASRTRKTTSDFCIASSERRRAKILHRGGELGRGLDSGRVDQAERVHLLVAALELEGQLDRVAGRAGQAVDDQAVALEEPVGERGLADVRAGR
jgi:hypothetical protein